MLQSTTSPSRLPRGATTLTEAAFPARVVSGYTIPTGSVLASRRFKSGATGAVNPLAAAVRPLIATSTVAPGLQVLLTAALDLGACLISGGAMGVALAVTATTYFAAPLTTLVLPTATAIATPAMSATAMAAAGGEHSGPAPETDVYKIIKGTKQSIRSESGKAKTMDRRQLISTNGWGSVISAARENYRFMAAEYFDHCTKFNVVYLISTKNKTLTILVKFVQALAIPLGLRLLHLRNDDKDKLIADFYRDYYKTTVIIQQFSQPNTPEQNSFYFSERNGRRIMDAARCMLNGAALPYLFWEGIVVTALFLLNRLPNYSIRGDAPYCGVFDNHADLSFMLTIGPVHMGATKSILRFLRGTPYLHITYSRRASNFKLIGCCYDASHGTGNFEKARYTS